MRQTFSNCVVETLPYRPIRSESVSSRSVLRSRYYVPIDETDDRPFAKPRSSGFGTETAEWPLYRLETIGGTKYVSFPRHYGLRRFGRPSRDLTTSTTKLSTPLTFAGELRDFQRPIVACVLKHLREREPGCLVQADCGVGKTVIGLAIAAALGVPTIVLVHKEFLLTQWIERIETFLKLTDDAIGIVRGKTRRIVRGINVGMVQTIMRSDFKKTMDDASRSIFDAIDLVVFDEAHHAPANCFSRALDTLPARFRIGLTATPHRADGLTNVLHDFLGPTVIRATRRVASVRVCVRRVTYEPKKPYKITRLYGSNRVDANRLVKKMHKDATRWRLLERTLEHLIETREGVILLVTQSRDAVDRMDAFMETRYGDSVPRCKFYGETSKKRKRARDAARAIARVILATKQIVSEGFDDDRVRTLFAIDPCLKSAASITQTIGRILRGRADEGERWIVQLDDRKNTYFEQVTATCDRYFRKHQFIYKKLIVPAGT